jgi:hypothetical protein
MTENQESTGRHAADETEMILSITKRPHRSWVSLNNDNDMAHVRITPRFKRNVGRAVVVGAALVAAPEMAIPALIVGTYQSWSDNSNSTASRERRGETAETTKAE